MSEKKLVHTGTKWESLVGYSRAVRVGPHVAVSGCAPVDDDGQLVGVDDAYLQLREVFGKDLDGCQRFQRRHTAATCHHDIRFAVLIVTRP